MDIDRYLFVLAWTELARDEVRTRLSMKVSWNPSNSFFRLLNLHNFDLAIPYCAYLILQKTAQWDGKQPITLLLGPVCQAREGRTASAVRGTWRVASKDGRGRELFLFLPAYPSSL